MSDPKMQRLFEVWRLLTRHGVCDTCASNYATVAVERESGDPAFRPFPSRCSKVHRRGDTCKAITADVMEAALWESVIPLLEEAVRWQAEQDAAQKPRARFAQGGRR